MVDKFSKLREEIENETPAEPNPTPAKWPEISVGFALVFCCLMSSFTFCDRFAPDLSTWWNSPRHCECQKCLSDHALFLDEMQTLKRIERAMGVNPKPVPMPSIRPNQIPLPPITPPASADDTGRPYIEF